jgi:hypothetical protein
VTVAEHHLGLREAGAAGGFLGGQCRDHPSRQVEIGFDPAAIADRPGGKTAEKLADEGRFAEARRGDERDDRRGGEPNEADRRWAGLRKAAYPSSS